MSGPAAFDTHAPEQLEFWREHLPGRPFVYFIQHGEVGPVKIGLSGDPVKRIGDLQTGNPRELLLRHVVPGDRVVEAELHHRFRASRIRGEWFGGLQYLAAILTFASGLAEEMLHAYDGSGIAPRLIRGEIRNPREVEQINDIERLNHRDIPVESMPQYLGIDQEEIEEHFVTMCRSQTYDIYAGRYYLQDGTEVDVPYRRDQDVRIERWGEPMEE